MSELQPHRLPNFLIVGAAKTATTSMHHYLSQHPDIFMPKQAKELMFLAEISEEKFEGPGAMYAADKVATIMQYENIFSQANGQRAVGEASVPYLYYHEITIKNIDRYIGSPKIIISLRNPIDRAYSNYLHHVRDGVEDLDFNAALAAESTREKNRWWWGYQYRKASMYYEQVSAYLRKFGEDNVHVFLFEDFVRNPEGAIKDVLKFLGVDHDVAVDYSKVHNASHVPRSPWISGLMRSDNSIKSFLKSVLPVEMRRKVQSTVSNLNKRTPPKLDLDTRKRLAAEFSSDVSKLGVLIGRDLSDWMN